VDGSWTAPTNPSVVDGTQVTATQTDTAGNTSPQGSANVADTTAPTAPEKVVVGNGDDFITKDEIDENGNVDAVVTLPDNAKVGDVVVVNGQEHPITQDDITAGTVTVKVPAPAEGEKLEVNATIKDPAGNVSTPVIDEVTRDTVIPGDTTGDGVTDTAPVITIPEALDGVNAAELADGIQTNVTVPT
ncbi:hypothetical protein KPY62_13520, partial [Psychrobacter sp. TAE2020]|uniref:hypothetical protein n=1 Tax=Psychrobacter sp. TAE2020 TaxID=2846762 RepID=UPI002B4A1301